MYIVKPQVRIEREMQIVEAMVDEMAHYLIYDGLFYPLSHVSHPRLTIGSCLMRQHRLLSIAGELDKHTADRLTNAVTQFHHTVDKNIVRLEQHTNTELQVRIKQWHTYLEDVAEQPEEHEAYYATHVADRAILKAIFDFMQPPYQTDTEARQELDVLDFALYHNWEEGSFVWAPVWQPAYPQSNCWWLYGRPEFKARKFITA